MKAGQVLKKSEQTRERIFDSALSLFQKKGFEETTMRDIAKEAGVALGSAYYYFSSKDEIVSAFYTKRTEETLEHVYRNLGKTKDFESRFTMYTETLLKNFEPYREMVAVLVRNGVDPRNINSPFNPQTKDIRSKSIRLIEECINGSTLKYDASLKNHLAIFYWFFLLAIFFFWTFDGSKGGIRTRVLFNTSLKLSLTLLKLGRLPLLRRFQGAAVSLLEELWPKKDIYKEVV